jgi:hypothetical protein
MTVILTLTPIFSSAFGKRLRCVTITVSPRVRRLGLFPTGFFFMHTASEQMVNGDARGGGNHAGVALAGKPAYWAAMNHAGLSAPWLL